MEIICLAQQANNPSPKLIENVTKLREREKERERREREREKERKREKERENLSCLIPRALGLIKASLIYSK